MILHFIIVELLHFEGQGEWDRETDKVPLCPGGQHGFVKDKIDFLQC